MKEADLVGLVAVMAWLYLGYRLLIARGSTEKVYLVYRRFVGFLMIVLGLVLAYSFVYGLLDFTP